MPEDPNHGVHPEVPTRTRTQPFGTDWTPQPLQSMEDRAAEVGASTPQPALIGVTFGCPRTAKFGAC